MARPSRVRVSRTVKQYTGRRALGALGALGALEGVLRRVGHSNHRWPCGRRRRSPQAGTHGSQREEWGEIGPCAAWRLRGEKDRARCVGPIMVSCGQRRLKPTDSSSFKWACCRQALRPGSFSRRAHHNEAGEAKGPFAQKYEGNEHAPRRRRHGRVAPRPGASGVILSRPTSRREARLRT